MFKNLPRSFLSIFSVNLLYLVTIVLNLGIGNLLESLHFTWGLIASEILLFLFPTIAFLRLRRIPIKEGLSLKPIRPLIGLLCILLGFTTYLFTIIIDSVMARLISLPSVALPAEAIPQGTLEYIGFFFAVVVVPPLCEEALFRGAIQGTYEKQRTVSSAIAIVALMFAFWHFQLSGAGGLLLVAFIFGYVAWRSGSIFTSILVHFGLNAAGAANSLLIWSSGKGLPFLGLPAAGIGLVATVVLIYVISRVLPKVEKQPVPAEQSKRGSWQWNYFPMIIAGLIYLGITLQTLLTVPLTLNQAGYDKVHIDQVLESRFRITNLSGDEVGGMNCTITPQGLNIRLDCAGNVRAYIITTSSGNFKDEDHTLTWSATWDTNTMGLLDFTYARTYTETGRNIHAAIKDGRLAVENSVGTQVIALGPSDLVEYEWAWRVQALKPQLFRTIQAPFAYILWSDKQAGNTYPLLKNEVLHLFQIEPLNIPAGHFQAHKASLGGQVVWYADDHPGPVRIEDDKLIYDLEN